MANPKKRLGTGLEKRIVADARAAGKRANKQPLSGVLNDYPNDAVVEDILVEAKVRAVRLDAKGKRIISIDLDWLDGVLKNAAKNGFETGIVVIRPKNSERLLTLMLFSSFLEMLKGGGGEVGRGDSGMPSVRESEATKPVLQTSLQQ